MANENLICILFLHVFCLTSYGYVPESEVSDLKLLYDSTNGVDWNFEEFSGSQIPWDFTRPLNETDPCSEDWGGLKCTSTAAECNSTTCHISWFNLVRVGLRGNIKNKHIA